MHFISRFGRALTFGLAVISLVTMTAFAAPDSTQNGIINADELRLRSQPSLSAKILTRGDKDDPVIVIGDPVKNADGEWFKVLFKEKEGYMACQYIQLTGQSQEAAYGKIDGTSVRFREKAAVSSKIIKTLGKGDPVELLGLEDGWYKVIYKEQTGFIFADYIKVDEKTETEAEAETASGKAGGQPVTAVENAQAEAESEVKTLSAAAEVPAAEVSSKDALLQEIVDYAKTFLGCKYVYGTMTGKTFDCSGLTSYVYKKFGYALNRSAAGQLTDGKKIASKKELLPGDLVLFRDTKISTKAASHVGMYIGSGQFIHASSGTNKRKVVISDLGDAYYTRVYIAARRIIT